MRFQFKNKPDAIEDLWRFGLGIVAVLLCFFLDFEYGSLTNWAIGGVWIGHGSVEVTKEQAVSMIDEHKIKVYTVRSCFHRSRIFMKNADGKWFCLDYPRHEDVVMKLGQHSHWVN